MDSDTAPPLEELFSPKKSRKKLLTIAGVLIVIVVMVLASTYMAAGGAIASAASTLETSTGNIELTNLSLNPLFADFKGDLIIKNPSNVEFNVNRVKMDIIVEYGSTSFSLGEVDVSNKPLPANGFVTIPVTMHCGSELLSFLTTHSSGYDVAISGVVSVSGKYLFWTITNEKTTTYNVPAGDTSLSQSNSLFPTATPTQPPIYNAPTPTPNNAIGFSRSNPAPVGTTVDLQFQYLYKTYYAKITVTQVVRGSQAWSMLQEANMFNSPSDEGHEYALAKIRFEYTQGPTADTQYSLSSISFNAISKDGVAYDYTIAVEPDPSLSTSLYPGATHEGWAAYQVAINDTNPLLSFARDYDGTGGVWFSLTQTNANS